MADDEDKPGRIAPEDAQKRVQDLIGDVVAASLKPGGGAAMEGMADVVAGLQDILARTGVEIPGMAENLAELTGVIGGQQARFADIDAAMWAGDLDRARMLRDSFTPPEMPFAPRAEGVGDDEDTEDEDEDWADDEDLSDFGMDEIAGMFFPDEDALDLYADIEAGAPGAVAALLESGADPRAPSGPYRRNALFAALDAPGRNPEDVAALIAAGCNPGERHETGDDAVIWAMGYRHAPTVTRESERALVALLAEGGGAVNGVEGGFFMTPLHRAIIEGGPDQVAALLDAGADPSVETFETMQPEMLAGLGLLALAAPKPEVVRLLLDRGLDPARPDGRGRLAADFVREAAIAARARATDDWTRDHAGALEVSARILEEHAPG